MNDPIVTMPTKEVPDSQKCGAMIRSRRNRAGVTLTALAQYIGVSKGVMSEMETGLRNWEERRFQAAALGINELKQKK